jgi:hypothetical protein
MITAPKARADDPYSQNPHLQTLPDARHFVKSLERAGAGVWDAAEMRLKGTNLTFFD